MEDFGRPGRVEFGYFTEHKMLPEQELAIAVIQQAMEDLQHATNSPLNGLQCERRYKMTCKQLAGQDARHFFASESLEFWSDLAGIDSRYVKSLAKQKYPEAFK